MLLFFLLKIDVDDWKILSKINSWRSGGTKLIILSLKYQSSLREKIRININLIEIFSFELISKTFPKETIKINDYNFQIETIIFNVYCLLVI